MGDNRGIKVFVTILSLIVASTLSDSSGAFAQSNDWTTEDIGIERASHLSTHPEDYGPNGRCVNHDVLLPNEMGRYREISQCVFQAKSFTYTVYDGRLYLNLSGSNVMYPVINFGFRSNDYITPSPGTDDIVFGSSYFKDVPSNVVSNNDPYHPGYLDLPNFRRMLSMDERGISHDTSNNAAISNNGRWIVLNFTDIGIVKFDALDMSVEWIAPHRSSNEFYAISNDGNTLVSVTWGYDPVMVYDLRGCGEDAKLLQSSWFTKTNATVCKPRDLSPIINEFLESGTYTSPAIPSLNNESNELTIFVRPDNIGGEGIVLKIVSKYNQSRLDYLALGDSYSSGEGDVGKRIDGKSFYLPTTDYKGGCHVSSRSYPFLIKTGLRIGDDRMKSVACSGARVAQDYYGDSTSYRGQGNRIKYESTAEQESAKRNALTEFTPGILKQLDFVKEMKPKFVTLTGGGNDVGFASILTYCALPSGIGDISNTCDMALGATKQRSLLGDAITSQYEKTLQLIAAVKTASKNTKIYIIGYPSFAAEDKDTCLNAAMLNTRERIMINRSVTYLNFVLSQAAKSGGASYIDVEKSLYGGRICEGSSLMTGPLNVLGFDISERKSEMFHPNHLAHEKLAKTIFAAGISAEGDNPQPDQTTQRPTKPEFFGSSTHVPTFQDKLIRDGAVYAGKALLISVSPGIFAVNQALTLTIWSDETKLGVINTNSQGGVESNINLPSSVKPGYHLLLAEGKSHTGEPTQVYQFVEVKNSINDNDGDGIVNNQDPCEFLIAWYDEQTGKDICATSKTGGINIPASHTQNNDGYRTVDVADITRGDGANQSAQNGSVLGVHDVAQAPSKPIKDEYIKNSVITQIVAGIGSLLILLGLSTAIKLIRSRP